MIRKLLSILLASVLLISCFSTGLISYAANKAEADIPIVFIAGGNCYLRSADGRLIYPVEEPEGYIMEAVKDCLPSFAGAVLFGSTEKYKEKFMEWMAPLYTDVILDKNGENVNGSHPEYDSDTVWVNPNSANCDLTRYTFAYDFRLDPYANAEKLARYIGRVKAATGADEISLYARCEGASVMAAYLDVYGDEGIHKIAFFGSGFRGNEPVSKTFSGKIDINADMLDAYASSFLIIGDDLINEYFWALWDSLREIYGIEITASLVNKMYKSVVSKILPDFLLSSYATFVGAWPMVREEDYREALDFIFYNDDIKAEYKGLYDKITYYHDHAAATFEDRLLAFKESGREVGVFTTYGFAEKPLFVGCDDLADGDLKLVDASFGATTAKWGKTLPDKYIAEAVNNGTDKYIAPDKQVDASTCLFPDTTWFIKNCYHGTYCTSTDAPVIAFFHSQGMTVDSYEQYPQYMIFHEDTFTTEIMTEENCNTEDGNVFDEAKPTKSGFFASLIKFIKTLFNFLSLLFKGEELNFSFGIKYM